MNQQIFVWCAIVAVLLFALLFRAIVKRHATCHNKRFLMRRVFEIGRERDIFFIPGDCDDDDF